MRIKGSATIKLDLKAFKLATRSTSPSTTFSVTSGIFTFTSSFLRFLWTVDLAFSSSSSLYITPPITFSLFFATNSLWLFAPTQTLSWGGCLELGWKWSLLQSLGDWGRHGLWMSDDIASRLPLKNVRFGEFLNFKFRRFFTCDKTWQCRPRNVKEDGHCTVQAGSLSLDEVKNWGYI